MHKNTNPFYVLNETLSVLKILGTDPFQVKENVAKPNDWTKHVLTVMVDKVYSPTEHFKVNIHLTHKGLLEVVSMMDCFELLRQDTNYNSEEFDYWYCEPVALLRFFALEQKQEVAT